MTALHYPGCYCGACQAIRDAKPAPPVPLAYFACCSAIVRLTRTGTDTYTGTATHLSHCQQAVALLLPKEGK